MTNPDLFNDLDPDELLRTAAAAARRAIPLVMQRMTELQAELNMQGAKLLRLKQVAAITDQEEPDHFEKGSERRDRELRNRLAHSLARASHVQISVGGELLSVVEGDGDPQALSDIKRALYELKEPAKVAEISEYIKKMSEREWGSSTIYNHLNKGKAAGVFANANNKWSLTEQGQLEMMA